MGGPHRIAVTAQQPYFHSYTLQSCFDAQKIDARPRDVKWSKDRPQMGRRGDKRLEQIIQYFRGYYCIFSELIVYSCDSLIIIFDCVCNSMCFLKALKPLDDIAFDGESSTDDSSCRESPRFSPLEGCMPGQACSFKAPQLFRQDLLLADLMGYIHANSARLASLHQKLSQNEHHLLDSQIELEDFTSQNTPPSPAPKTPDVHLPQKQCDQLSAECHPLLARLFGAKEYDYRLEVQGEIAATLFKERNINIPLGLVDRHGQKVLNSNIIHLCLGVCDANGEWVAENRTGEPFMKGKTEVEMYHGEGAFLKVYPRDISRHYPQGKLSFVVYSKPSLLQFSSNASSVEKVVHSSQIQPLLIADLQIKAKKC